MSRAHLGPEHAAAHKAVQIAAKHLEHLKVLSPGSPIVKAAEKELFRLASALAEFQLRADKAAEKARTQ